MRSIEAGGYAACAGVEDAGAGAGEPRAVGSEAARASLRLNRRSSPRRRTGGTALLVARRGGEAPTIARVELMDATLDGVGIRSPLAVACGSSVALYFNGQNLPGRSGRVARCEADGGKRGSYRVGVVLGSTVISALSA